MVYQVLVRVRMDGEWEPFQGMTRDPIQTMRLLQQAGRKFTEVSVIQAESVSQLREQLRRLRAGAELDGKASPVPSLSGTPRISVRTSDLDDRRWLMEQGAGGDHDVPYRFDVSGAAWTLTRWARLVERFRSEVVDLVSDAELFPDDLRALGEAISPAIDATDDGTTDAAVVAEIRSHGTDHVA